MGEWWFEVPTTIGGVDHELERKVEAATDMKRNIETQRDCEQVVGENVMRRYSGELFTIISSLTSRETSTMVRGVINEGYGKCGFRAVRRLMLRFNPKTLAKLLQKMGVVINPGGQCL